MACDVCKSKRYNRETLEVEYKGKNIAQVLEMTVEEGGKFFLIIVAANQIGGRLLNRHFGMNGDEPFAEVRSFDIGLDVFLLLAL